MYAQSVQLSEYGLCAALQGQPGGGRAYSVTTAIQQLQIELLLEPRHGGENRRV
jgi:hypothetical protein